MKRCKTCGNTNTIKRTINGTVSYLVDYNPNADRYIPELTPVYEIELTRIEETCICGGAEFEDIPAQQKSSSYRLWDLEDP